MATQLFDKIEEKDRLALIACLGGKEKRYKKGEILVGAGEKVNFLFWVKKGVLTVENNDVGGNSTLVSRVTAGGIFGGAFAFSGEICTEDVRAETNCLVTLLPAEKMLSPCEKARSAHAQMVRNLVAILAAKSVSLLVKIDHISARGIRGKVLAYLSTLSARENSRTVRIPFSRQEMANYLSVDRSALSKELSAMQSEGVIQFNKNLFTLLD